MASFPTPPGVSMPGVLRVSDGLRVIANPQTVTVTWPTAPGVTHVTGPVETPAPPNTRPTLGQTWPRI